MNGRQWRTACRIAILFLSILFVVGAGPERRVPGRPADLAESINEFTVDVLRQRASAKDAPANTILSPQGIYHGMAMSYVGSGTETREELAAALHFPDDNEQLIKQLAKLRKQLHEADAHDAVEVSIANAVWLDTTYVDFREDYLERIENGFGSVLHGVSFTNREAVCSDINKWVSEQTRGKIADVIEPKDIESRSRPGIIEEPAMVTVNAVYFKGDWASCFDEKETEERTFHVDATTKRKAQIMHQRSLLPYAETEALQFLVLPYVEGYSMCVVLPKEILSVEELTALTSADTIPQLNRSAREERVDVLFPKFEMRSHISAMDMLKQMGVQKAFVRRMGVADFEGMFRPTFEAFTIYISECYHDAWIALDEKGTEAAAATTTIHHSIGCSAPAPQRTVWFHADHPFLFAIVHDESQSMLFAGWISDPAQLSPPAPK
jgi:serpin B